MLGKSPSQNQGNLFKPLLSDFINLQHPLVLLANKIPWQDLEKDFAQYYSHTGKPSMPVRMMVGLLLLKQMYDLGDESLMPEWVRDPYFQYFCGEACFQHRAPCDPSDLVHFRKRIGTAGVERIFELSVWLHAKQVKQSRTVLIDTTVQEKNITYPTDAKLYKKIIDLCKKLADQEGVKLRQSYVRTSKKLLRAQHFSHHPKRRKQALRARRKLKTLAGRQVRDLSRNLSAEAFKRLGSKLELFERVLEQEQNSKNKIYSLHEVEVACIAKGKAHKKYEFGSKVSVASLPGSNIIVGIQSFTGNPHDSQTLEPTLDHLAKVTGRCFPSAVVDRGYRGKQQVGDTEIISPRTSKGLSMAEQRRYRKRCRSRAAIEPLIAHLKYDYRLLRNYLKGVSGDQINALLAATAFNMCKWLKQQAQFLFAFLKRTMLRLYMTYKRLKIATAIP